MGFGGENPLPEFRAEGEGMPSGNSSIPSAPADCYTFERKFSIIKRR